MPTRRDTIVALSVGAACASLGIYGVRLRDHARTASEPGQPPLSPSETSLVAAMVDGIIPKTDTPGALEAGVPAFIAMMFSEWLTVDEQRDFRTGLRTFEDAAVRRYGAAFASCSPANRHDLLVALDQEVDDARRHASETLPPFARLKALTVIGYYTSEIGQTIELKAEMTAGQDTANGPVFLSLVPFGAMI